MADSNKQNETLLQELMSSFHDKEWDFPQKLGELIRNSKPDEVKEKVAAFVQANAQTMDPAASAMVTSAIQNDPDMSHAVTVARNMVGGDATAHTQIMPTGGHIRTGFGKLRHRRHHDGGINHIPETPNGLLTGAPVTSVNPQLDNTRPHMTPEELAARYPNLDMAGHITPDTKSPLSPSDLAVQYPNLDTAGRITLDDGTDPTRMIDTAPGGDVTPPVTLPQDPAPVISAPADPVVAPAVAVAAPPVATPAPVDPRTQQLDDAIASFSAAGLTDDQRTVIYGQKFAELGIVHSSPEDEKVSGAYLNSLTPDDRDYITAVWQGRIDPNASPMPAASTPSAGNPSTSHPHTSAPAPVASSSQGGSLDLPPEGYVQPAAAGPNSGDIARGQAYQAQADQAARDQAAAASRLGPSGSAYTPNSELDMWKAPPVAAYSPNAGTGYKF